MAEMVASALVQEGVSGVVSLAISNPKERASHGHLMERLEMAQSDLEFALERSSKVPITDVSLLRRRMTLKCVFMECTAMLQKHKLPGDEEVEQRMVPVSSSFRTKIMHAMQPPVRYFYGPKKDLLTRSEVKRFEWFAEKADKFVRDVESGCSVLARYKFSNPIVTKLLEGKFLEYKSQQGKKSFFLAIGASRTEDHGVMAYLWLEYRDPEAPMNEFSLHLILRLSESTDIVGISTKCLRSLGPNFKGLPEVATGQLAYLSTHLQGSNILLDNQLYEIISGMSSLIRPDPVCYTTCELKKSCSSNTFSSELSGRFPEEVTYLSLSCNASGADYNLRSSNRQVNGKSMKAWQYLELNARFYPHLQLGRKQVSSLHHMEETMQTDALNYFSCQAKKREYNVSWWSAHGAAFFTVLKRIVERRCSSRTVGDGSQRVSKRKR